VVTEKTRNKNKNKNKYTIRNNYIEYMGSFHCVPVLCTCKYQQCSSRNSEYT